MKNDKQKLIKQNLSTLLKKFSKNDVIVKMETEYTNANAKVLPTKLIDDNAFLKNVKISGEDLRGLHESVISNGIITPLVVRPKKDHFEIVLGRKRLFVAKELNIQEVPVIIRDFSDEEMLVMLLAFMRDNRDMNSVGIAILCNHLTKDFHYTQQSLADLTHQSRSQITNTMRLLNLPEHVLNEVSRGRLSYGHAKSLATLPESVVNEFVVKIMKENLSVRTTERMVARYKSSSSVALKEKFLSKKYNSQVQLTKKSITLTFSSENELKLFLEKLEK